MATKKKAVTQKEALDALFDEPKIPFLPQDERIIKDAMAQNDCNELASDEELLAASNLLTKNKKVNLGRLDKVTRMLVKETITEQYNQLLNQFEETLLQPNVTKEQFTEMLKTHCQSIIVRHPEMTIKFTNNGSIDLRTIFKPFRNRYRELEAQRKEKFKREVKSKLAANHDLSAQEIIAIAEEGKKIKRPFEGKFKN